nr:hypothetical protein [Tanacetum cinerariifolium]
MEPTGFKIHRRALIKGKKLHIEYGLIIASLKDELRKLKWKALVDNVVTRHTIALEMLKVDMEPLAPRLNSRTRKSGKDAESSKDSRSKEKKSLGTFKDASKSEHKSSSKYVHRKEPSNTIKELGMQQDQEFVTGTMMNNLLTRRLPKLTGSRNPNDLQLLILIGGGDSRRRYSTSVTKTKTAIYELKWIEDLVPELWSLVVVKYDKHAYFGTSHWGPKRQTFYGYASNLTMSKDVYSRRRIIAVTRLTSMKKYYYGHLEEIEVRRDDQPLYTFKEGDFKRIRLQDIEDMLLLLVQQKLTNLTIDERYDLNVALRMFTRCIVIQRQVEDLQLGIESYQKKLNLTKPNTYRSNIRNKTTYTSHSDPHGIIYVDQSKRKRLMHTDELHKFSDGTLNDVRTALHDIATGLRMDYLLMRR